MRLNIGLPGPFSTSTEVGGKGCGQGCLIWVCALLIFFVLACCVCGISAELDGLNGKDTITTEGVTP